MKYIFLLALVFISTQNVFAQPSEFDTNSEGIRFADDGVTPLTSGPTGGLTNSSPSNTSGGVSNSSGANGSGGVSNSAPLNTSGGVSNSSDGNFSGGVSNASLPELDKPNLTIVGITNWFIKILNYIGILLFTAALVMFLYGIFMLMFVGGASEDSRSKGKKFMFWGIVSLFVMTSTWGLVNVLRTSIFGNTSGGNLILPQLK